MDQCRTKEFYKPNEFSHTTPHYYIWTLINNYVGKKKSKTHRTATTRTDAGRGTCKDACGSTYMKKKTHGSTSNRSTCAYDRVSTRTDVSTERMGVHVIACSYISTKGTGVNVGMSMDVYTGKTVVCRITCAYEK